MTEACARCGLFHPAGRPCLALSVSPNVVQELLPAGMVVAGRYTILHTIHRGGMSVVYLAEDLLRQGHRVVLKELRLPAGATPEEHREAEAWFARESYLLSSLRSPLIPQFYSVFQENGYSYIVQEYVAGENLDQLVSERGPLDENLVIGWGVALCDLLSYLHEPAEPVVYRDLKPANILVRHGGAGAPAAPGSLAVVDFGIARPFHHGEIGTVIGTPGYAPPEQYQGLATPQSDVYALGATLHRLLTGYNPEQGMPFTFPPPRLLNPRLSPEVAAVVERAVQLDPAARFESARTMGAALRHLAHERGGCPSLVDAGPRAVQSPVATYGVWTALVLGALLLGPMRLALASSFIHPPAPTSVPFVSSQGGADNPGQGWAPIQDEDGGWGDNGGQALPGADGQGIWSRDGHPGFIHHVHYDGSWRPSQ